jgi:DNA polymerase-3 subunit alpha
VAALSAPSFVHLHNHTEFSLLDGGQRVPDLIRRAKDLGMGAVAMTDHGNLFGAVGFHKRARKEGLNPILGCEVYLAPGSRFEKTRGTGRAAKPYCHMLLLAENREGFDNLVKLVSYGYLEGFYHRPRIDRDLLRKHARGLICLSGCISSEIPLALLRGEHDEARRLVGEYQEIFGEQNFFLELQDHGLDDQKSVNAGIVRLHEETGIPLVATNDVHFLTREAHGAHDVLICIGTGKKRSDPDRMVYSQEHYFKDADEMLELFPEHPEALSNTVHIAERCDVRLDTKSHHLPRYPTGPGETLEEVFRRLVLAGFERRSAMWKARAEDGTLRHSLDEYSQRLEHEIETILGMGFPGYFLITADFIDHARGQGIPVGPGRGSAAGSLVAYCLGITDIDPLEYDLLFERFLNPERVTMPDIDIDFCFRRRGEVIEYVTRKYGRENVTQIITFGTMAARAAIRDAGRVLDLSYGDVDRIAKLVPDTIGTRLSDAIRDVPQLARLREEDEACGELLDVALRLEGMTRHPSVHAAGVVVTPRPVIEYVPLFRTSKDEITTQWAMGDVEEVGLLKMDFLGLKTLTLIDDCLSLLRDDGIDVPDETEIPLGDPQTYELFGRGDTSGVFQFESPGMRDILRRMKPERFEDLIALNALYRPGPLGSGMIEDYIQRRHGKVEVDYPHPLTEPILRETYGVIVYQEQVMQIASAMAGYSLGQADLLRRAMGKKKKEVMDSERDRFVRGARERGIEAKDAERIFELMAHFAGYGFNKSHSAAYALVAYRTAWLKARFRLHFMAALLTNELGNTDKLVEYVNECRSAGLEILPPSINMSGLHFCVEEGAIRFGLAAIRGVGEGAVEQILSARERIGRFSSLDELCCEVDRKTINRRVLEALIKAGALDEFGERAALFAAIDPSLERGARAAVDRSAGQVSLFGEDTGVAPESPTLPTTESWPERERLAGEKESLGFYLQGHPLDDHREKIEEVTSHGAGTLPSQGEVAVGGMIASLKRRRTRRGEWMATFTLEDTTGQAQVVVFPKLYAEVGEGLEEDQAVVVHARADSSEGDVRLFAERIVGLSEAEARPPDGITLTLDAEKAGEAVLDKISALLADRPGQTSVYFEVERANAFRVVLQAEPSRAVKADRSLLTELRALLGDDRARLGRP